MRLPLNPTVVRVLLGLVALAGTGLLLISSDDVPVFTTADKAYYADAETLNYIRPGLKLTIVSASIADDGKMQVRFKVTDPKGIPLDREGVETAGAITTRWVMSYIPNGQSKYRSYIVRETASTLPGNGGKASQVTDDSGGRNNANYQKVGPGEYIFTFNTKPTNFDKTATHTVGVWASRDLAEFEIDTWQNSDSKTFSFVPDGSAVKNVREVIKNASCNRCHGGGPGLQAHGTRRGLDLCILCHNEQTSDPDTMQSLDMPVMAHKIHMGEHLPSGNGYKIIGHNNSVADFSHVALPTEPNNCTICHEQTTGAAQAANYLTKPTRATCGSCHDDVNFTSGKNHFDMPQLNDSQCARCHEPEGEMEFDASIKGAHVVDRFSRDLPGVVFDVKEIRDAAPGSKPTVVVKITDKAGNPITSLGRLSIVMAGPTIDYPKYITEDASKTKIADDGTLTYTFTNAIPADAKGTFAFGFEGRRDIILRAGTARQATVRDAAMNVVKYVSVDGSPLLPRRQVVALEKCNSCHGSLALHGGNRNQIEQCVLCHNANMTDASQRPADQGAAQSISMAYMIHRIHTGEAGTEGDGGLVIYGNGKSRHDFSEVAYPADRRECTMCHIDGTQLVPLSEGVLNVQNPRGVLNPMGPATGACTGCHTEIYTASHALSNTTEKLGEACGACHSEGYEFGIRKMHAR